MTESTGNDKWQKLNSSVSYWPSALSSAQPGKTDHHDPSLVVLFGWMDARSGHLRKYADTYREQYPNSNVIVIHASSAFFARSPSAREKELQPALSLLEKLVKDKALSGGILLHCFSNGGVFQLVTLQKAIARSSSLLSQSRVPCALVLDSCPGDHGLQSAIASMVPGNPLLRIFVIPVIAVAYGLFFLLNVLRGRPQVFPEARRALLQPQILPFADTSVPRAYIYSMQDRMVNAKDVESHIAAARENSITVTTAPFLKSAHVTHARTDPDRYWQTVRGTWDAAVGTSQ